MDKYSSSGRPQRISEEESGLVWDEEKKVYRPSGLSEVPGESKSKWIENSVMGWVFVLGVLFFIIFIQVAAAFH